jgi:hypothetical protein
VRMRACVRAYGKLERRDIKALECMTIKSSNYCFGTPNRRLGGGGDCKRSQSAIPP